MAGLSLDKAAEKFRETLAAENVSELTEAAAIEAARRIAFAMDTAAAIVRDFEAISHRDNIAVEKQTFSVGHACGLLRVTPNGLRGLMQVLGIDFAGCHNDVPFVDGPALVRLSRHLRDARRSVAEAADE